MKRKVILHADVLRTLGALRLEVGNDRRFVRSVGTVATSDGPNRLLFLRGYDADELLAALNDLVYKFDEEV